MESLSCALRQRPDVHLRDCPEAARPRPRYESSYYDRPARLLPPAPLKPDDYVARVAFAYPDDEDNERKWQQQLAEQKDQQNKSARIAELPPNAVESMFFDYRLKGGDDTIRPVRVFDDGKKTYIQISAAAKNREVPVLVVIGTDGKQEMVNYRVKDDMYIVDRLVERAELILGSGKKARKVEIDRERKS
jgi:type IV secretion system protein TrbG